MSEGFSADWLRLREPFDARARDTNLAHRLAAWVGDRDSVRIVDLGAGTGANLRWLSALLPAKVQDWTLVEHDPVLIASGSAQLADTPASWRYRRVDLAAGLETLADANADIITASALLDLISAEWLDGLVAWCRRSRAALYLALSYDGRMGWDPVDDGDQIVAELVNAHQRSDKGFGPALGPDAVAQFLDRLDPSDGDVVTGASDWQIAPSDAAVQHALLAGYEAAAITMDSTRDDATDAWARRRAAFIEAGHSRLRVGHRDLLLLPR